MPQRDRVAGDDSIFNRRGADRKIAGVDILMS